MAVVCPDKPLSPVLRFSSTGDLLKRVNQLEPTPHLNSRMWVGMADLSHKLSDATCVITSLEKEALSGFVNTDCEHDRSPSVELRSSSFALISLYRLNPA
jgi:hypothetical protein